MTLCTRHTAAAAWDTLTPTCFEDNTSHNSCISCKFIKWNLLTLLKLNLLWSFNTCAKRRSSSLNLCKGTKYEYNSFTWIAELNRINSDRCYFIKYYIFLVLHTLLQIKYFNNTGKTLDKDRPQHWCISLLKTLCSCNVTKYEKSKLNCAWLNSFYMYSTVL